MTSTVVTTSSGNLRGVAIGNAIAWRGVPYAAAPVGASRWRAPHPAEPWEGVRDASRYGPRALQKVAIELVPPGGAAITDADAPFDEDCLCLNICAPRSGADEARPVVVWFHGGGYIWGSGAQFNGDGAALAERGVIVVTVNYRLGALGFLRLDHLLGDEYMDSVNAGLLDQIAALRWVRENIAAFGGDPARVTIAGVSAGAKSVANLMAAPAAGGLFTRAIIHSGGDHLVPLDEAAELTEALLGQLGLAPTDAEQLLDLPGERIIAAQQRIATGVRATWLWRPALDGRILPERPIDALRNGSAGGVGLIAGVTANEAGSYVLGDPTALEQTGRNIAEIFDDRAPDVFEAYRASRPNLDDRELQGVLLAEERYAIPTIRLLDAHAEHGPSWRYRFDGPSPNLPPEKYGFHGSDIPFLWNVGMDAADEETVRLGTGIRAAWVSFMATGTPAAADLPHWPQYDREQRATLLLDRHTTVEADPRSAERRAWDGIDWTPGPWWQLP